MGNEFRDNLCTPLCVRIHANRYNIINRCMNFYLRIMDIKPSKLDDYRPLPFYRYGRVCIKLCIGMGCQIQQIKQKDFWILPKFKLGKCLFSTKNNIQDNIHQILMIKSYSKQSSNI